MPDVEVQFVRVSATYNKGMLFQAHVFTPEMLGKWLWDLITELELDQSVTNRADEALEIRFDGVLWRQVDA